MSEKLEGRRRGERWYSQQAKPLTSQMPVTTKPTYKRNKKTVEVVASDEEVKPTVTVDATTASESEAPAAAEASSSSDSESSGSVALPIPSKKSSKASSRRSSSEEVVEEVHVTEIPPELKERLEYIQHLIREGDEEMLERMLRVLQCYPYHLVEQENLIRSALAEMNRRIVAHEQHTWAEERAAAEAAAQAAAEAAERAAMEAEEARMREYELAELAKLQAKYKKPVSKCEIATRIFMGTCAIVSITLSFMK